MSKYRAFRSFTSLKTGKSFFSEVWYFNDWSGFKEDRKHLFAFLQQQGTITPVTLDLTENLARTGDPYVAGLHAREICVTQYSSNETSGYFLVFSTDFFPGENYYIAYYGTDGQSDLVGNNPSLKTLIMSSYPGFVENRKYTYDPSTSLIFLAWAMDNGKI
ncbi:hypothetical protein [Methanoregula sp.]|uniref:hypothetical protein n=1 Tax=Methanoregula sp. TaxID=2052170 RepID=UPI0035663677